MTCDKKFSIIAILKILEDKTDPNHPLTYDKIGELLESDYNIKLERRAIARNVKVLMDNEYDIEVGHDGTYIVSKEFDDSELKLLIDNILSNKFITKTHTDSLIKKLMKQASQSLKRHISYVEQSEKWSKTTNSDVFLNVELIDEAIAKNKQIQFDYMEYDQNRKLVPKHPEYKSVVSPYRMLVKNQRYYLMCQNTSKHRLSYYKIDKIQNIEILDANSDDINDLPSFSHGVNNEVLSDSLPYVFSDPPQIVKIECKDDHFIDTIYDWFGTKVRVYRGENGKLIAEVKSSLNAMKYWALQYIDAARVVAPIELVQTVKNELKQGLAYYEM